MTPLQKELTDWELSAILKRYQASHELNLSVEQARQVYEYEQLRDTPSQKHFFSLWEELDFEYATFQNILTSEQWEGYEINHQETIRFNEQQLAQQDQEFVKQINAATDLLHYYQNTLLPDLYKQRIVVWQAFHSEREKIEYLKAEYKKYLNNKKKLILAEHFRHSRLLQPRLLQLSLLHHQLTCLLPDYYFFRENMQAPTRAVADYLEAKLNRGAAMIMEGLKDTLQAFKEFSTANTAKHLGKVNGWHGTLAAEESSLMFLLLLDKEK
jgi:hypothetical protein